MVVTHVGSVQHDHDPGTGAERILVSIDLMVLVVTALSALMVCFLRILHTSRQGPAV